LGKLGDSLTYTKAALGPFLDYHLARMIQSGQGVTSDLHIMVRDICNIIISPDKWVKAANENKQSSERLHYMQASKDQLEATRVELHQQAPDFFDPIL